VLEKCAYLSLRDEDSRRLLLGLGIDAALLHRGADLALLMPAPHREQGDFLLRRAGVPTDRPLLGVVLRRGKNNGYLSKNLLAAVRTVCRLQGWVPLFLIHDEGDEALSHEGATLCGGYCFRPREAGELLAILGQCRAAVTMRLHAMILAARGGTPALGIPGDPRDGKIAAFARQVGYPVCLPEEDSVTELARAIVNLMTSPPHTSPFLADSLGEQRKKAWKDLANVLGMLYNKGESSK
jgi:polysaccharide pyruvyl transferase WcaK-like protein